MEPLDDVRIRIEAILGPCPFGQDDERYATWLVIGQAVWQAQARHRANMLDKLADTPLESMPGLFVDAAAGHYDIIAGVIAVTVTDYRSAAVAEKTLETMAEYIVQWSLEQVRNAPRSIRDGVSRFDIQSRLRQRVSQWTVKILDIARDADSARSESQKRSAGAPVSAAQLVSAAKPPTAAVVSQAAKRAVTRRFPDRAVWLRAQLSDRRWTAHDVERFYGPNARTVRKILDGHPVRKTVLEKLANALSEKGAVSPSDIPNA